MGRDDGGEHFKSIQAEGGRCERKVIGEFKNIQAKERDGESKASKPGKEGGANQKHPSYRREHRNKYFKMIQAREGD